jgi:hypothetical protein
MFVQAAMRHGRCSCNPHVRARAARPREPCFAARFVLYRDRAVEENPMLDLILIGLTVGFFALTWLYVRALARLGGGE